MIAKILLIIFIFSFNYTQAQQTPEFPSDSLIMGPEIYREEVIKIFEKYNHIQDSLTNLRTDPNYQVRTDKKYNGNDGKEGYFINLEMDELKKILEKFLDIKRVKAIYSTIETNKKEVYYEVNFEENKKDLKDGMVRWYGKFIEKSE